MADGDVVHVAVTDGVATITLDSPENRNALSTRLVERAATRRSTSPRPASAGGRAGHRARPTSPPAFCAGADLKERRTGPPDSAPMVAGDEAVHGRRGADDRRRQGPGPCRRRRADGVRATSSSCAATSRSRSPRSASASPRRSSRSRSCAGPAAAGWRRRSSPASRSTPRSPATSGSITHVTDDVDATVAALCDGIRMGAPRAVAETKRMLRVVPTLRARRRRSSRCAPCPTSCSPVADGAEGMAAFAEKRRPSWHATVMLPVSCASSDSAARLGPDPPDRSSNHRRAAAGDSMSSSDTSTRRAASPSGTNESCAATRRTGPVEAGLDEPGDDRLADAARCAGSRRRRARDRRPRRGGRSRRPAAAPASAGRARGSRCPSRREAVGDAQRQVAARCPTSRSARRRPRGRPPARRSARASRPQPIGGAYGAVQPSSPGPCRSRVWYSAIGSRNTHTVPSLDGRRDARAQHRRRRRPGGPARRSPARGCRAARRARCRCGSGRRSPSGSRSRRCARPAGSCTARWRRTQARRLAAQLVLGVVQVGEVLDLRDRHQPGHAGAERQPEDRLLVEQRVEDPPAAGLASAARG